MFTFSRVAAIATLTLALSSMADAQPFGSGRGMMGPGMMIGPGIMNRGGLGRMCDPATAGFAEWRISRLEQLIRPTDAQRLKLDELKAASTKASEAMRSACPTDIPATMPGRMEAMEKRMEAMLQAVKTVRPALDAFYATLTDQQKAQIDSNSGRGRFWRWRE